MQKQTIRKHLSTSDRRFRFRPLPLLLLTALLFVLCGLFLTFVLRPKVSTSTPMTIATKVSQQPILIMPVASQENTNQQMGPQQPTSTPVDTLVVVPPTLVASTPQHTQLGVFALSKGGPLPVPESVLRPTNIARTMLGSTLVSVYAGSVTRNPQAGILCVLREDITTGELHLQEYQGPQTGGALTILSIQKNVLKVTDTKMQGFFDLNTGTFQW